MNETPVSSLCAAHIPARFPFFITSFESVQSVLLILFLILVDLSENDSALLFFSALGRK